MILKSSFDIPEFMSCSSFEYPDSEFILYTGSPKMLFAVVEEEPKDTEFFSYVEHSNGESDYVVVAECFEPKYFEGKSQEQTAEVIGQILGDLEEWYISEIMDLDNYDE